MKTKELQQLLGITKETLRYYEREGIVVASRDENGYRNYNENDLTILKIVLLLRSMEVSIDEIKLILQQKLSMYECLQNKKQFIESEIKNKELVLNKINESIARKKAHYILDTSLITGQEIYLCFTNDALIIHDPNTLQEIEQKISYQDITKIKVSLCSREYLPYGESYGEVGFPLPIAQGYGFSYHYFVDLDIEINHNTLLFESTGLQDMVTILTRLQEAKIPVEDPLQLLLVFTSHPDELSLTKYFDNHCKKWHQQFGIDHPRGNELETLVKKFKAYNTSIIHTSGKPFYKALFIVLVLFLGLTVLIVINL